MSQANFQASLVCTADTLRRAAESNPNIPVYTVDSLRQEIEGAFHLRGGPISDFPPLFWCGGDDRPQLDAGQHRREAFLNVVDPDGAVTRLIVISPQIQK
jgi:hypothetical protein